MSRKNSRGFTLVEMLVVITIIGMLMGLLLPAVNMAREAARKATCANNQKQIATALTVYESTFNRFPGYVEKITGTSGYARSPVSWAVCLFPYLEHSDLWDLWTTDPKNYPEGFQQTDRFKLVKTYVCPSSPPLSGGPNDTPLAYVVNCGWPDAKLAVKTPTSTSATNINAEPTDTTQFIPRTAGVFHNMTTTATALLRARTVNLEYIRQCDGASSTLMLAENIQPCDAAANPAAGATNYNYGWSTTSELYLGFVWGVTSATAADIIDITKAPNILRINSDLRRTSGVSYYPRPSAYHSGGVNVSFCDGRQYFLKEGINPRVYCQLMAPDDKNVKLPGLSKPFPYTPLSDGDY